MAKLGELMLKAGVKGVSAEKVFKEKVKSDALERSARAQQVQPTRGPTALERLPDAFLPLRAVKDGKAFMSVLRDMFDGVKYRGAAPIPVTVHTAIGLAQLVHWHVDRTDISPSRKKSFAKIAWWFIDVRDKIQKNRFDDAAAYFSDRLLLDERTPH